MGDIDVKTVCDLMAYDIPELLDSLVQRASAAESERDQWKATAADNQEAMESYREHAAAMRDRAAAAEARTRELEATVQRVEELARKWRTAKDMTTGSGSIVARAFAIEIEAVLRGSDV